MACVLHSFSYMTECVIMYVKYKDRYVLNCVMVCAVYMYRYVNFVNSKMKCAGCDAFV